MNAFIQHTAFSFLDGNKIICQRKMKLKVVPQESWWTFWRRAISHNSTIIVSCHSCDNRGNRVRVSRNLKDFTGCHKDIKVAECKTKGQNLVFRKGNVSDGNKCFREKSDGYLTPDTSSSRSAAPTSTSMVSLNGWSNFRVASRTGLLACSFLQMPSGRITIQTSNILGLKMSFKEKPTVAVRLPCLSASLPFCLPSSLSRSPLSCALLVSFRLTCHTWCPGYIYPFPSLSPFQLLVCLCGESLVAKSSLNLNLQIWNPLHSTVFLTLC